MFRLYRNADAQYPRVFGSFDYCLRMGKNYYVRGFVVRDADGRIVAKGE
jgi:hypothetical protein